MTNAAAIHLPNPFGRYELIKQLGSGGMGSVWLARDTRLNRKVALKVCKAATTREAQERFRREAQAAAALNHPNLCPIYDFDEHDGVAYIAMAFIEGSPLSAWVQGGAPDQRQSAFLVAKLALAMQEAHEAGVIHRDLKPDNVTINKKGEPIVLDFGLARQMGDSRRRITHAGKVFGTPAYMAPEQAAGETQTIGPACDVYALGVMLYELLTGVRPFAGPPLVLLFNHINTPPVPPRQHTPSVDPALEAICLKALAKHPAERHPSMKVFAQLLDQAAKTLGKAPAPVVDSQPPLAPTLLTHTLPQGRVRNPGEIETLDLGGGVAIRFAWVPAGTFFMGGGGGKPGEQRVEIARGFALGIYPVTQEQWQTVMDNNPSSFARKGNRKDKIKTISDADLRQFPIENISWKQAQEFIARLNERFHNAGWRYRLPTEAEWEYSCREGASSPAACSFHFYLDRQTNDLSSAQANFDGKSPDGAAPEGKYLQRPTKVGSYKANGLGLYDMHGNVWEWCQDRWEEGGSNRVLRGGSWGNCGSDCRAANRYGDAPSYRNHAVGFRLARVPSSGK